ncbi:30S ribosomal protein S6 [Candidatus Azambacteria bacterium]|nr:30S ribosomal protein S6 [Candidatus Azambacteria bacterium]
MIDEQKRYELTFLLSPDIPEEEFSRVLEPIEKLLQSHGASIETAHTPRKRQLAYPIKKMASAAEGTIEFRTQPEKLAGLEKALRLEPSILRLMITEKEPHREPSPISPLPRPLYQRRRAPLAAPISRRIPEEKKREISEAEFEEKIGRILTEEPKI